MRVKTYWILTRRKIKGTHFRKTSYRSDDATVESHAKFPFHAETSFKCKEAVTCRVIKLFITLSPPTFDFDDAFLQNHSLTFCFSKKAFQLANSVVFELYQRLSTWFLLPFSFPPKIFAAFSFFFFSHFAFVLRLCFMVAGNLVIF